MAGLEAEVDEDAVAVEGVMGDEPAEVRADGEGAGNGAPKDPASSGGSGALAANPKGKAKGKGKAKAKAKSKLSQLDGAELSGETKKCKDCRKDQPIEYFQEKQTSCVDCRNLDRQIMSMADRQKVCDWIKDLKANEPKEYAKLRTAVRKETPDMRGRRTFDIVRYKETVYARGGIRYEGQKKMMWEGEYYEWAKSVAAGFLTKPEMQEKWRLWNNDASRPTDALGPRGYKRLVHMGDFANEFEETGKEKAVEALGRGIKKCSEDQAHNMMQEPLSGHAEKGGILDFEAVRSQVLTGMISQSQGDHGHRQSALAGEGLMAPTLQDLMANVKSKKPGAEEKDKSKGSDQSMDKSAEKQAEAEKKTSPGKADGGWWDVGKVAKAQREAVWDIGNFTQDAQRVKQEMADAVDEFQKDPEKASFTNEMKIVSARLTSLTLVLNDNPAALREHLATFRRNTSYTPRPWPVFRPQ